MTEATDNSRILEYLRSEKLVASPAVRKAFLEWKSDSGSGSQDSSLGLFLVEKEALTLEGYLSLLHALETRQVPCPSCGEVRYIPSRKDATRPCKSCGDATRPSLPAAARAKRVRFEDYELETRLGQGAMGVVYRARYVPGDRIEALKILQPQTANERRLKRFERECELLAKIRHRNIVGVHRAGEHAGLRYLALEYVDGGTLKDLVDEGVELDRACELVAEIADGLSAAHAEGVIHRDLKPANVLVDEDGVPRIADFGLAVNLADEEGRLTRTGAAVGTPVYMSPEQLMGRRDDLGPGSDTFALGVILYELVTGERPYHAGSLADLTRVVRSHRYRPLRELRPDAPQALENLIHNALEPRLNRRLTSAEEFRRALVWIRRPEGPRPLATRRSWPRARLIGAFAAALLLILVVAFVLRGGSGSGEILKGRMTEFVQSGRARLDELGPRLGQRSPSLIRRLESLGTRLEALRERDRVAFDESGGRTLLVDVEVQLARLQALVDPKSGAAALRALARFSGAPAADRLRARLTLELGRPESALEQVEALLKQPLAAPERRRVRLLRASILAVSGRLEEATTLWEDLAPASDERGGGLTGRETMLRLGALLTLGRVSEAEALLERSRATLGPTRAAGLEARCAARKDPSAAWSRLNHMVRRAREEAGPRLARAGLLRRLGFAAAAREDLSRAAELCREDRDRVAVAIERARLELTQGDPDACRLALDQARSLLEAWFPTAGSLAAAEQLEHERRSLQAERLRLKASLDRLEGRPAEAGKSLAAAKVLAPLDPGTALVEAAMARAAGRHGPEIEAVRAASRVGHGEARVLLAEGRLAAASDPAKARSCWRAVLRRAGRIEVRSAALLELARLARKAGQPAEARLRCREAALLDSEAAVVRAGQRLLMAARDEAPAAEAMARLERRLRQAMLERPRHPGLLACLAGLLRLRGRPDEAVAAARAAIEANPEYGPGHRELGLLSAAANRHVEATRAFARAVACDRRDSQSWSALGAERLTRGELQPALDALDMAVNQEPWRKEHYVRRAAVLRRLGQPAALAAEEARVASFEGRDPAFEQRVQEAVMAADPDPLLQLALARPGRPETMFDFGRILGVKSAGKRNLAISVLAMAHAVARLPELELPMVEYINQFLRFGNLSFRATIDKVGEDQPRYDIDARFCRGLIELYAFVKSGETAGEPVTALLELDRVLDRLPAHVVARSHAALALVILGYEEAVTAMLPVKQSGEATAVASVRALLAARRGDRASLLNEARRGRWSERVAMLPELLGLFPERIQRDATFRELLERKRGPR